MSMPRSHHADNALSAPLDAARYCLCRVTDSAAMPTAYDAPYVFLADAAPTRRRAMLRFYRLPAARRSADRWRAARCTKRPAVTRAQRAQRGACCQQSSSAQARYAPRAATPFPPHMLICDV
jgi:hypothetical protein